MGTLWGSARQSLAVKYAKNLSCVCHNLTAWAEMCKYRSNLNNSSSFTYIYGSNEMFLESLLKKPIHECNI